jgi:hypothetical protein
MFWDTTQTPDALRLNLSGSNIFILGLSTTPDLGIAAVLNPTLVFHDGDAAHATHWTSMTHNGSNFVVRTTVGKNEFTNGIIVEEVQARGSGNLDLSDNTGAQAFRITTSNVQLYRSIVPDINNTNVLGSDASAMAKVVTNILRPSSTGSADLVIQSSSGAVAITITTNTNAEFVGNILTKTTNSATIGTASKAFTTVFTRAIQTDTGSLVFNNDVGAVLDIRTGTNQMLDRVGIAPVNNNGKNLGNSADAYLRVHTGNVRPNSTDLNLESTDGTQKFSVNNTGIAWFAGAPVAKAAVLTTVDATVIDATYGATEEAVINNTRTRLNDLESRLQAYNLLS